MPVVYKKTPLKLISDFKVFKKSDLSKMLNELIVLQQITFLSL